MYGVDRLGEEAHRTFEAAGPAITTSDLRWRFTDMVRLRGCRFGRPWKAGGKACALVRGEHRGERSFEAFACAAGVFGAVEESAVHIEGKAW